MEWRNRGASREDRLGGRVGSGPVSDCEQDGLVQGPAGSAGYASYSQLDVIMRIYAPDIEAMKTWTAPKAELVN